MVHGSSWRALAREEGGLSEASSSLSGDHINTDPGICNSPRKQRTQETIYAESLTLDHEAEI